MKPRNEVPACAADECGDHDWEPLFRDASCTDNVLSYMSQGHADYKHCRRCGAVGMVEGNSTRKPYLLSAQAGSLKIREAAYWNASQEQDA